MAHPTPKSGAYDFDSVFAQKGVALPDSRLKFLDTLSKTSITDSCAKVSTYLHKFANEPSTALFRIREHVLTRVPELVQQSRSLRKNEKRTEKALFDVKYALIASRGVYNARKSVRKISNLLNYHLFRKEPEPVGEILGEVVAVPDAAASSPSSSSHLPEDRDRRSQHSLGNAGRRSLPVRRSLGPEFDEVGGNDDDLLSAGTSNGTGAAAGVGGIGSSSSKSLSSLPVSVSRRSRNRKRNGSIGARKRRGRMQAGSSSSMSSLPSSLSSGIGDDDDDDEFHVKTFDDDNVPGIGAVVAGAPSSGSGLTPLHGDHIDAVVENDDGDDDDDLMMARFPEDDVDHVDDDGGGGAGVGVGLDSLVVVDDDDDLVESPLFDVGGVGVGVDDVDDGMGMGIVGRSSQQRRRKRQKQKQKQKRERERLRREQKRRRDSFSSRKEVPVPSGIATATAAETTTADEIEISGEGEEHQEEQQEQQPPTQPDSEEATGDIPLSYFDPVPTKVTLYRRSQRKKKRGRGKRRKPVRTVRTFDEDDGDDFQAMSFQ